MFVDCRVFLLLVIVFLLKTSVQSHILMERIRPALRQRNLLLSLPTIHHGKRLLENSPKYCYHNSKLVDCLTMTVSRKPLRLTQHFNRDVKTTAPFLPPTSHVHHKYLWPLQESVDKITNLIKAFGFHDSRKEYVINHVPTNNVQHQTHKKQNPSILNYDVNINNQQKTVHTLNISNVVQSVKNFTKNKDERYHDVKKFKKITSVQKFSFMCERLERAFYLETFKKLLSVSPEERKENGISFVQSGLFMVLFLIGLTTELDDAARREIEDYLWLNNTKMKQRIKMIDDVVAYLPQPNNDFKFHWAYRLAMNSSQKLSEEFKLGAARAMSLKIENFNGTEKPEEVTKKLNQMVEVDSGNNMRDTFDDDEVSNGISSVLLATAYVRPRWRSSPTLLNGTRPFHDYNNTKDRQTRMIRINDNMMYSDLKELKAEAIEISYAVQGLSLLMLVPRDRSLYRLAHYVGNKGLKNILMNMHERRLAVTLPLYTIRMTLLLPSKLEAIGISEIVNVSSADNNHLRLSHAVQRLMFWSEAGQNAFKDDGIEWDQKPERELILNRPYLFFLRWRNLTIMNGNFVL